MERLLESIDGPVDANFAKLCQGRVQNELWECGRPLTECCEMLNTVEIDVCLLSLNKLHLWLAGKHKYVRKCFSTSC